MVGTDCVAGGRPSGGLPLAVQKPVARRGALGLIALHECKQGKYSAWQKKKANTENKQCSAGDQKQTARCQDHSATTPAQETMGHCPNGHSGEKDTDDYREVSSPGLKASGAG